MGRIVTFTGPGEVAVAEYEERPLGPGEVRLATLYSGISAGTELTAYRGSNPYLNKRWDGERRLFVEDAQATLQYPVEGWGYEEVGEVTEAATDVRAVKRGDVVWGAWGHRSTHVLGAAEAGRCLLDPAVDPVNGVFAHIGAIALNAVLDADIHVGETVAVFGQGVPGLLATQLAARNGAEVVAVDRITRRLELARRLGAARVVDATDVPPAEAIRDWTGGRGADASIEFTGSYRGLQDAIRSTAYNSRVVASGFFQGEGRGLHLGEEFHHNRIEVVCSQISGVAARYAHRWDEHRLRSTVMRLRAEGQLELEALVSHRFPVEQAADAFRLLAERPADVVQVVLRMGSGEPSGSP
jgi:2-desacetyl-2-hydroxyethyl bacteriochlorophyllide A dehydrogenase